MTKFIFAILIILSVPLYGQNTVTGIPEKGKSGEFLIKVDLGYAHRAQSGVKALLVIPDKIMTLKSTNIPVVVFYHGSTTDQEAYKTVGQWKLWAAKYGFVFLSVQNWWPLSGDFLDGAIDSANSARSIVEALMDKEFSSGENIFSVGFSAGGLTAFAAFLWNIPDPIFPMDPAPGFNYRGFGTFKGNYIEDPVLEPPMSASMPEGLKGISLYMRDRLAWISMGGKTDAPRVLLQAPKLKDYVKKYLGIEPTFKIYPQEGHVLTDQNFSDFWSMALKVMK